MGKRVGKKVSQSFVPSSKVAPDFFTSNSFESYGISTKTSIVYAKYFSFFSVFLNFSISIANSKLNVFELKVNTVVQVTQRFLTKITRFFL